MFVMTFNHLIFGLLGMAPFGVHKLNAVTGSNRTRNQSQLHLCVSKAWATYNLLLVTIVLIGSYVLIPNFLHIDASDHSKLSKILQNFLTVNGNIFVVILFLLFFWNRKRAVVLGNQFIEMDAVLTRFDGFYRLKTEQHYVLFILIFNLITSIALTAIRFRTHRNLLSYIPVITYHNIIFSFYILQYAIVVIIIREKFECLNNALRALGNKVTENRVASLTEIPINQSAMSSIIIIKRAYALLHKFCSEVANFYGPLTIFIVIYFSASVLYVLYNIMILLTRNDIGKNDLASGIILNCFSNFFSISLRAFPFLILTTNIRKTSIEMLKTSGISHRLHANYAAYPEIKTELENFIIELLHRDFQFTACRMFSIDCSLLKSMFSIITTYLIIFVQFQLANLRKQKATE